MEKNFELTEEFKINSFGIKLFRIKAIKKFNLIEIGYLGGFVEKLENVCDNAWVSGNARIYNNARICHNAWVYDTAEVYGNAIISGNDIK